MGALKVEESVHADDMDTQARTEPQPVVREPHPRPWWQIVAVVALGLLLGLAVVYLALERGASDPNTAAKDLALRHAQALARRDYAQRWEDAPPACQSDVPKSPWVARQRQLNNPPPFPPGQYRVVNTSEAGNGAFRAVTVRVTASGYQQDWEFDLAKYGHRWAVADWGLIGHVVEYGCKY